MAGVLNPKIKDNILQFIRKKPMGCSSVEISKGLKINRVTLTKYLSSLYSEGIVGFRNVGMAKLWFFQNNPLLRTMLHGADSNKTLKLLLNSIGVGLVVVDETSKIVWLNDKMKKVIGDIDQTKGKNLIELTGLNENELLILETLKEGVVKKMNVSLKGKKYLINLSPFLDKEKKVVGAIGIFVQL
jgi:transcriptional regulator with PAS, ATPase and Fis domain